MTGVFQHKKYIIILFAFSLFFLLMAEGALAGKLCCAAGGSKLTADTYISSQKDDNGNLVCNSGDTVVCDTNVRYTKTKKTWGKYRLYGCRSWYNQQSGQTNCEKYQQESDLDVFCFYHNAYLKLSDVVTIAANVMPTDFKSPASQITADAAEVVAKNSPPLTNDDYTAYVSSWITDGGSSQTGLMEILTLVDGYYDEGKLSIEVAREMTQMPINWYARNMWKTTGDDSGLTSLEAVIGARTDLQVANLEIANMLDLNEERKALGCSETAPDVDVSTIPELADVSLASRQFWQSCPPWVTKGRTTIRLDPNLPYTVPSDFPRLTAAVTSIAQGVSEGITAVPSQGVGVSTQDVANMFGQFPLSTENSFVAAMLYMTGMSTQGSLNNIQAAVQQIQAQVFYIVEMINDHEQRLSALEQRY